MMVDKELKPPRPLWWNLFGGNELHLTVPALKINGLPGVNDTINIGGTNLTFKHGILTGYG